MFNFSKEFDSTNMSHGPMLLHQKRINKGDVLLTSQKKTGLGIFVIWPITGPNHK